MLGERLLPAATAVAPAIRIEYLIGSDATTRADVLSAVDQEDALELVLRGQDGTVIATEDIGIIDTHYLLSIAESDADDMSALDADQDVEMESLCEEWTAERELVSHQRSLDEESEFPRYQIQIRLVDHDSLP